MQSTCKPLRRVAVVAAIAVFALLSASGLRAQTSSSLATTAAPLLEGVEIARAVTSPADTVAIPEDSPNTLPDTPVPQDSTPQTPLPDHTHPKQTQRILGIMPNFRSVSADQRLPPQTVKDKFLIAGRDSFDYSSFVIAAIQTSVSFASDSYPEFHHGVVGYGRYYWHTLADTADENFLVGGALPAVFHQDSRFYTLGHGNAGHRALYAASRILISRRDNGDRTFNFSEVIGAGAAAGISSTYYPSAYRDWTKVGQKWLTGMIIDSANFSFKEFWPDINGKLFHTK